MHAPTQHLDKLFDVWVSKDKNKIGIDVAATFGGKLLGLHVSPTGIMVDSIDQFQKERTNACFFNQAPRSTRNRVGKGV